MPKSLDEIYKSTVGTNQESSIPTGNKPKKSLDELFKSYQPTEVSSTDKFKIGVASQSKGFDIGTDLDKYTPYIDSPLPSNDIDQLRALNQSNWEQTGNALLGGIGGGLATAVEGVSYMFDPTTWGNMLGMTVDYDRNWLADLAVATKQNIYEALPIYRENPNEVFDFGDFAWYMDTTRSLIDSAVGFGIPGLGVAKGVGMASKAFRALSYADKANDVLNVLRQTEKTSKIMQSLSAGYLTNHMETMVMTTEMYDGLLNSPDIKAILDKGGKEAAKAKSAIAQEVHNFALSNKVFALTNALQIGSVIKTRGQLSKSGVKSFLKDLAKDAPIEAFEEAGQGVSQKFFEDMTRRDLGLAENYDSSSLFNKAMDIFMQEETALEAMMGLFGGPVQYAITKAPLEIANMKEANKWKEKQQQVLEKNKEYVENIGKRTKQYETLQKLAKDLNNQELANQISDLEFENIAVDNFEAGIADQLERSLQDIVDNKQQEYTAEEVKIAEEKIDKLKELEKQWNDATKYENPGEIFRLEVQKRHYEQQLGVASPLVDDIYKDALNRYNQKLTVLDSDKVIRNRALNIGIDNQELSLNEPVGVTTDTSQEGTANLITPTFESIRENVLGELSGRKDIKDFNKAKKILEQTNQELAEKKSYKHQRKLFKAKQQEKRDNKILEKAGKTESLDELNRLKDETTNPEVKAEIENTIQNKQQDKKEAITGKKEDKVTQETPVTPEQPIQQNEEGEVVSDVQEDDFNIPSQTTQQTPQTPNESIEQQEPITELKGTTISNTQEDDSKSQRIKASPNKIIFTDTDRNNQLITDEDGYSNLLLSTDIHWEGREIELRVDKAWETYDTYKDNVDKVAIAVFDKATGEKLGGVQLPENVKDDLQREKLNKVRQAVFDTGKVETKIKEYTVGRYREKDRDGNPIQLYTAQDEKAALIEYYDISTGEVKQAYLEPLSTAIGDDVLIGYKNTKSSPTGLMVRTADGKTQIFSEASLDEESRKRFKGPGDGQHWLFFKVGVNKDGEPIYKLFEARNNRLSEEIADTIILALEAYQTQDEKLLKQFSDMGYDVSDVNGIENFISLFTVVRPDDKTDGTTAGMVVRGANNIQIAFATDKHSPTENGGKQYQYIASPNFDGNLGEGWKKAAKERLLQTYFTMNTPNYRGTVPVLNKETGQLENANIEGNNYMDWVKQNFYMTHKPYKAKIQQADGTSTTVTRLWQHPQFSYDIDNIQLTTKQEEQSPIFNIQNELNELKKEKAEIEKELKEFEEFIKIDNIVENDVTADELKKIAQEEGTTEQDAKQKVIDGVVEALNQKQNPEPPKSTLQRIVDRIRKLLLNLLIVSTLIQGTSFTFSPNSKVQTYEQVTVENLDAFKNVFADQEAINKLGNIQIITKYQSDKKGKYTIIDKSVGLAHLYEGDSLISTYEVGIGENKGDEQTVLHSVFKDSKGNEVNANEAVYVKDGNSYLKEGYHSFINWTKGNKQTGAGIYTVSKEGEYKRKKGFYLKNSRGISMSTALHKPTNAVRQRQISDGNTTNNRISNGCVNFNTADLNDLSKQGFSTGSKVYILPDDPHNEFKLVDGNIQFTSKNKNVNTTPIWYDANPIVIKAAGANNDGKEYLQSLEDSKSQLMELYPSVSNDVYNRLIPIAYGIFGQESSYGTYGKFTGQVGRITDIGQVVSNALGLTKLNPSIGVTQIRMSSVRQNVRNVFKIQTEKDLLNTSKAAQATMALLLDMYVNEIPSTAKETFEQAIPLLYSAQRKEAAKIFKGETVENAYSQSVINKGKDVTVYMGEGTYDKLPISKKQKSNPLLASLGLVALVRRKKQGDSGVTDNIIADKKKELENRLLILNTRIKQLEEQSALPIDDVLGEDKQQTNEQKDNKEGKQEVSLKSIEEKRDTELLDTVSDKITYNQFIKEKPQYIIVNNFDVYELNPTSNNYTLVGVGSSSNVNVASIEKLNRNAKSLDYFKGKNLRKEKFSFFRIERKQGNVPLNTLRNYKKRTVWRIDELVGEELVKINKKYDNLKQSTTEEDLDNFIDNELGLGGSVEDFNLPNEQYALNLDDDRLTELLNQGVFKSAFERINYLTLVSDIRKEIVAQLVEKGDKVNIEAIAQGYIKKLESTRDKILAKLEQADPSTPGYDRLEAFGKVFNTTLALDRKVLMDGVTNELRAIQQVKIALDEDSSISETSDNFTEQQGFEGTRSLTENHKSKISGKLKLFLSNIKDVTKDAQGNLVPKKSRFGQEERIPFDTAYDTLHTILVNTEPRLSTMMNKLSELKDIKGLEWLNEVVTNVQNADTDVQNGFVTDMAKHKVSMYFVRWEKTNNGKYKLKMLSDNSSDDAITLRRNWKTDLELNSGLFTPTGDDVEINSGRIDEIKALGQKAIDEANNIVDNNHIPAMLALGDYLASVGIAINEVGEISDGLRELYFNGIKTKEKKAQIVNTIVKKVNTDVLGPLTKDFNSDTYDPFRSNIFSGIANIQAQYQNRMFSTSFRVGDKNIWTFSNPKFLSLRLSQLNGEYIANENGELVYVPSETAKSLQNVVGARANYMVEELADPNSQLFSLSKREGLELAYTSVAPFKKARKAIGKDKSLRQLSDGEHEVIKLAFFTHNTSKIKSVNTQELQFNRRRVAFYFPTNSDKETTNPVYYYAFVPTYKMDEVGYIDDEYTQLLFNNLVAPEIDRIRIMGNGNKLNLNTYKSDLFYYLPELNSHVFTTKEGEPIRYAQAVQEGIEAQFEEEVKQIIRNRVQSEVDSKLKFWTENNIGLTNSELGKDSFLDGDYLSTVNNDQRKLAVDMVTNYMLFTSAMHATVIGDPAEYYKPTTFKEGNFYKFIESKDYTSEEYDALDTATKLMLEGEFAVGAVEESTVNLGKRLAADIAPGNQLSMDGGLDDNYIQLFFNDQGKGKEASASTEYMNTLKYLFPSHPEIQDEYGEIDATDAQEYTTVKEHLTFLVKLGKLSQKTADDLYKKIYDPSTTRLSVADIKNIFQPIKPVFVDNLEEANPYDVGNLTYNRRLYIKTSSFPLIPQLTKGKSIDNLRKAMEDLSSESKNLGVRAVFKSGTKVGFPKTGLDVLEDDGLTFKSNADITKAINSNPQAYSTLSRSGLRNQQENPAKDKYVVNDGTQQRKLLFNNILDKIIKGNKKGIDYLKDYEQAYDDLFKLKRDEFRNEVLDENGELNIEKLAQILRDEAITREYSKQDIDFLEVEVNSDTGKPEFIIPLELNPSSKKFQSLLNAIVNNRILKLKPPGYSFYLASEAGFGKNPIKQTDNVQQVISDYQDDVIYFTKNGRPTWDGKSLEGMRYTADKSKVLPAQILVQPKIKLPNGKTLMDYVEEKDGSYYIETGKDGKFDEELLQIFGYRIPTQGHNSMSYIEIVGFLPETSGDLVVAPMHFTKQMGSDFDIDKLFTHMYASAVDKDGNIQRADKIKSDENMVDDLLNAVFGSEDYKYSFSEANLWNKIMDIHRDIMLSPIKEVQQQIHYTLGFDNLKFNGSNVYSNEDESFKNEVNNNGGIAQAIANKESKERNNQGKLPPSILSDSYQREKYTNANAAAVAIGAFAIDNTFHALAQKLAVNKNQLQLTQEGTYVDLSFGTLVNDSLVKGKLGGSKAFNQDGTVSDKYISDIISAFLSSAVDNEKEQIINKININSETLGVVKAMSMAGYPSDIIALILTQPIIKEYVTEIQKVKSSLAAYDPNAEDELIAKLELKYGKTEDNSGLIANSLTQESNLSSRLYDMVGKDITQPKDKYAQLYTLERFLALKKAGDQIQNVQSIINTDSKFLGKSIVHNNLKSNKIVNGLVEIKEDKNGNSYVGSSSGIINSEKLVGNYIPDYEVSNPQELLNKGYVNVGNFYIRPSSISGFASIYGTLEAAEIYKPLFPVLNSVVVQSIFNSYIKTPDTRLEQEEQNMLDYFEEVKSHIYAQEEFFGEDGSTARLRLLNENTGVGAIINQLKKSEDPRIKRYIDNNEFLKRLEPSVINEKFKEVGVEFNGATALLAHDEYINFDFLNMLQDDNTILVNGVTPKQLAKDLILYSFATGGIQKATQFVRYVPTEVLKSTPALAYLKELSTSPKLRTVMETRNFITQYYQNNPRQAVALKPDNYVKLNETGSVLRIKKDEDNKPVVTNHDYIYEDLGYNQTRLYVWDKNNKQYYELETKNQSTNIKQYSKDYKSPNVFTKQVSVQSEPPLVPPTDTFVMGDDGKPVQVKPDSTNYHKELIKRSGTKQTLQTVLDGISSNSENQFTRELAKVFNKNLAKLPNIEFKHANTFKNTVDNTTINLASKAAFGAHVYDRNTNTITIAISPNLKNESTAKYEEIVMHEISHAFTVAGLQKKSKLKAFAGINRSYLRFMQELNDNRSKLSDEELKQLDYAASTLEEFTAMAMSNHTVQKFMNGYNAQETTNLVQSILKLLKEFLGLTEGTEAYALLSNIINLIETSDSQDLGFEDGTNQSDTTSTQSSLDFNKEFAIKSYRDVLNNFKSNIVGRKAKEFNSNFNNTTITDDNYTFFVENKLGYGAAFDGSNNYKENFQYWLSEENIQVAKENGDTELGISTMKKFFTELINKYPSTTQYGTSNTLGMSIAEFLRTLPKESRDKMRELLRNDLIKTKCK